MRKIATILLLIISIKAFSINWGHAVLILPITCVYDAINVNYPDAKLHNGLFLNYSVDPKMIIDSLDVDCRINIGYHYNRFEPYISYEQFNLIDFEALTLGLNYCVINRKLSLLTGFDYGLIFRPCENFRTFAVNFESKLHCYKHFYLTYLLNIRQRNDISKDFVTSGYIGVEIKF